MQLSMKSYDKIYNFFRIYSIYNLFTNMYRGKHGTAFQYANVQKFLWPRILQFSIFLFSQCSCQQRGWWDSCRLAYCGISHVLVVIGLIFKNKKREPNPEAQTTDVDTTNQELDLSKMNKEDNYQSLRVTAAIMTL